MKSKLGLSVGALGALVFFAALFGGYVGVLLVAGYIVLVEDNEWLRRSAVKAVFTLVFFSVLITVINLIPDLLQWISSLVAVFKGTFDHATISSIINVITKAIEIIRTVLLLILGVKAFDQRTVVIPVVDKFINKNF